MLPVYSQNQAFSTKYYFYQYNDNNFRIVRQRVVKNKGFEKIEKNEKNIDTNDIIDLNVENTDSIKSSISRAKRYIREYVLCNEFDYFVTLTLNSDNCDRFSLTACLELLRKTLKSYKRKNKYFAYVLITEKHEKGGFHFHGFFKGINNEDLVELNLQNYNKLPYKILQYIEKGEKIFSLKHFDEKMGYCTLSPIKHLAKACNYAMKYITKDCIRDENGNMYICSRGLKKALSYEILGFDFDYFGERVHKTEFTDILDYNLNELSQEDKLFLQYNVIYKDNFFVDFLKKHIDF